MNALQEQRLFSGGVELDSSPDSFGYLKETSADLESAENLQTQMAEDGYLYMPGFFQREEIITVRNAILSVLSEEGLLDPTYPVEQGIANEAPKQGFRPDIANMGESSRFIRNLIYGERMMAFYSRFLGRPAMHYDFTWLRVIPPGKGSLPHCDVVFMGRGTHELYTAWVPFGDIPIHVGGLILIEGSHRDEEMRRTYCSMDVDTTCQDRPDQSQLNAAGFPGFGAISYDMHEVRQKIGGRILTAKEFHMGDLLTFTPYTVHGSLDNFSTEIRLSSDSRYQSADEPADERWIGENPPGHGGNMVKGMIC